MPLTEKGNARWTSAELAHLVGKDLAHAHSLSADGGGPLPYSATQISSKMRILKKQVEDDAGSAGEFEPAPKSTPTACKAKIGKLKLEGSRQPAPPPSGYATLAPIVASVHAPSDSEGGVNYESDDEEMAQALRMSVSRTKPHSPHPPIYSTSPISTSSSKGWDTLVPRTAWPNLYQHALELDVQKRCPWIDLFIHENWVKILVDPIPQGASVQIDLRIPVAYIIIGDWNIQPGRPVTQSDASRSLRPFEFVFKFDLSSLGIDHGVSPDKTTGNGWACFTFNRS